MYVKRWIRKYRGEIRAISTLIVISLLFGIYSLVRNVITKDVEGSTLSSNVVAIPSITPSNTPVPSLVVPTTIQINIYINNTTPIYNQIYSSLLTQMPTLIPTNSDNSYPSVTQPIPTSTPNLTYTPIPSATPTAAPLISSFTGKYFNNKDLSGTPVLIRIDESINFNWEQSSPDPSIQKDGFSVVWSGDLNTENGIYLLTMSFDDGLRVYVDNKLVLDRWVNKPLTTEQLSMNFSEGKHPIRIEYFENLYNSTVSFEIQKLK